MAASGVKVATNVLPLINSMRVKRNTDIPGQRVRIMTLCINTEIEVDELYKEDDLVGKECVYEVVQGLMKEEDCKYIVYDCHYEVEDGPKEELIFIMWSSDGACMRKKLPYAASKSCIMKASAAKHELELHTLEDITFQGFAETLEGKARTKVKCLEGRMCHC